MFQIIVEETIVLYSAANNSESYIRYLLDATQIIYNTSIWVGIEEASTWCKYLAWHEQLLQLLSN